MKQAALAMVAIFAAGAVQAASLQWGLSEDSLLYVDDHGTLTMATDYSDSTAGWKYCLVYLGDSTALSINNGEINGTVVDSFDYGVYPDGDDAYAEPYTQQFVTDGSVAGLSVEIVAGGNFGIAFFNGDKYDYVYATDGSTRGEALTATASLPSLSTTANPVVYELSSGTSIAVVVPEPATAALALLGLGLLLKRRKA